MFAKLFLSSILISTSQTFAQTPADAESKAIVAPPAAPVEEAQPVQKDGVERVEVTGSHIKRIDVEGVSPVKTITRKELDKTGYNSVADVLRDNTANAFGSTKEAAGSNAAGNATVNLRGLGSTNTLVLLNGQRLPSDAVTGAVDLNLIPMAAIERVEVLKDGASAIYGSDALGGVVNIITRKDFKGTEISFNQTLPEEPGGAKQDFSLVNGVNREGLSVVSVLSYRDNKSIGAKERSWTDNGISLIGNPGSYRNASGQWIADPNCPANMIVTNSQGSFCSYKFSDTATQLPAIQQWSFLSEANYELNSTVKLQARLGGTQKKVQWSYASAPGSFIIPGAVADNLGPGNSPMPGVTPGQDLQVRYRLTGLGTRDADITTTSYNALLGANIQLNDIWQMDVSATHSLIKTKDVGKNGYALATTLDDLISNGDYNPFASGGAQGSLDSAKYQPVEEMESQLSSAEIKTSGEVGQIDSRPVGLAMGVTATAQKYEDVFDEKSVNGEVFGNAGSSGGGSRDTKAIFAEVSLPVTEKLEVQLAGRRDQYSDFGSASNPKAAFLYHPREDVLIRGSAGTGFKAPLMQDLYAATGDGNPTFIDAVSCQREGAGDDSCDPQQYHVTSGGNTGLKEEKSTSYNLGVVYEPNNRFSIGSDVYWTKINNVVGIDYNDAMIAESKGVDLAEHGVIVTRDSQGFIEDIYAPMQNLSSQEVSGIDLSLAYSLNRYKLSMEHSHLFYFKEEGFPGAGARNKLGENGRPAWRNAIELAYTIDDASQVSVAALTTPGQKKAVESEGKLPDYTNYDLQYAYNSKTFGSFSVGVKNVLGTTPPLDKSNPNDQLDTTIYDQVGRRLIAGYKYKF